MKSSWAHIFAGSLAIVVLTLLVYQPALHAGFVWDDDEHFSENPLMTEPEGLLKIWTQHDFYYPLTSTSFWLITRVFGMRPLPFHLATVLIHALNAVLLWRIARRLGLRGAFACGLVFALHPVHVQSVAWATELKNTQSGCFALLSMLCFLIHSEGRRTGFYWAALGFFLMSLLSKTSTVVLPFFLLLAHLWRGGGLSKADLRRLAPFFVLSLAMGLMTVLLHRSHVGAAEHWNETPGQRMLLAARGIWFYLGKLLWPSLLVFVYARWEWSGGTLAWAIPPAALAVGMIVMFLIRNRGSRRAVMFGAAFFVAGLLPVLNFFRMYYTRYAYAADHWQYLADMGLMALGTAGCAHLLDRSRARLGTRADASFMVGVALVMLLLGSLTFRQCTDYRDFEMLWLRTIEKNPAAGIAYSNLGSRHIEKGEFEAAKAILSRGEIAAPTNAAIKSNLALIAFFEGRHLEALQLAQLAIAADPDELTSYSTLSGAFHEMGRNPEAVQALRDGLARDPKDERLLENLERFRQAGLAPEH